MTPRFPRQRVRRLDHILQALARNMRVNLRRRNIRMTQHYLDAAEIRAALDKMRRKSVAQHVRR